MGPLLLRVDEAAGLAEIGRPMAYRLIDTGEWPSVRTGRSLRVPLECLSAFLRKQIDE